MAIVPTPRPARSKTDYERFRDAHPDFIRQISALRKLRDREFQKLRALPGRDRHSRTRSLLKSRPLHLLYAYEAVRRCRQLRDAIPATVARLAAECDPFRPCRERAVMSAVRTRGRNRYVYNFRPAKRMRQLLVADLLRSLHPPRDQQYLNCGGMPAAFRAVEGAIAEGFSHAAEIDMVDFYSSMRLEGLARILRPLPPHVIEHVVVERVVRTSMENVSVFMQEDDPPLNIQPGIPLGSACSPVVGELVMAELIASVSSCRVVAYADNMLVLGRSREQVEEGCEHVRQRAEGFEGWVLRPRIVDDIRDIQNGFEFLHHEARIEDGRIDWSPDQRKRDQYLVAEDQYANLNEIADAENKLTHWRRAYPDWPEGDEWETRQMAALAARRYYFSATPINRSRAAHALIASYFSWGRYCPFEEITPTGDGERDDQRRQQCEPLAGTTMIPQHPLPSGRIAKAGVQRRMTLLAGREQDVRAIIHFGVREDVAAAVDARRVAEAADRADRWPGKLAGTEHGVLDRRDGAPFSPCPAVIPRFPRSPGIGCHASSPSTAIMRCAAPSSRLMPERRLPTRTRAISGDTPCACPSTATA